MAEAPNRLVLPQWQFEPGTFNAITDVPGVLVGHVTVERDTPHRIRTGVTAILPHPGDLSNTAVWASGGWLNGNGELTGLGYIQESGLLTSPVMLTNTYAVGRVHDGVFAYFDKHSGGHWAGQLPVVGECWDGYFNTITDRTAIGTEEVIRAIESAHGGKVEQGRVGAGAGMRSFELHAGIGTASRKILWGGKTYHVGVLVNMNHSLLGQLDPGVRKLLETRLGDLEEVRVRDALDKVRKQAMGEPTSRQGSMMTVIATDLPMAPHQLRALIQRTALGIGAMGSTMNTTSGDGVVVFSTAKVIKLDGEPQQPEFREWMSYDALSPVYRATVEAVTEAQLNALLAAHNAIP